MPVFPCGRTVIRDVPHPGRRTIEEVNKRILAALEGNPLQSSQPSPGAGNFLYALYLSGGRYDLSGLTGSLKEEQALHFRPVITGNES
jgi:hypothetical protein